MCVFPIRVSRIDRCDFLVISSRLLIGVSWHWQLPDALQHQTTVDILGQASCDILIDGVDHVVAVEFHEVITLGCRQTKEALSPKLQTSPALAFFHPATFLLFDHELAACPSSNPPIHQDVITYFFCVALIVSLPWVPTIKSGSLT